MHNHLIKNSQFHNDIFMISVKSKLKKHRLQKDIEDALNHKNLEHKQPTLLQKILSIGLEK